MSNIEDLFQACDLDGSGSIDRSELALICPDLTEDEVNNIFKELDKDGDGTISVAEFSKGFQGLTSTLMGLGRSKDEQPEDAATSYENDDDVIKDEEWATDVNGGAIAKNIGQKVVEELTSLGVDVNEDLITTLSCQEQICELYQNLHTVQSPELLSQFEDIILSVIKDIRLKQYEVEQMESSYKKEKEQYSKHLQDMEEELESEVSKAEQRIRRQEQEKLEQEKLELKRQLESEIEDLKSSLKRVQQMEALQRQEKPDGETKVKLEELAHENRFLQSNLTDYQTKLALLRSELAQTKQAMEQKSYDLKTDKQTLMEYMKEQDNLIRQVHILHDANKKLHDTNDDLRSALENSRVFARRTLENTSSPFNKGEYVKQYLNSPASSTPVGGSSLADELSMIEGSKRKLLPIQDSCEIDSLPEDFDSGHSTMRDGLDVDSEYDLTGPDESHENHRKRSKLLRLHNSYNHSTAGSELMGSVTGQLDYDAEIDIEDDDDVSIGRCSNCSSRASIRSSGSRKQNSVRRKLPTTPISPMSKTLITKEPERMFKVVLAGDAAVGKSSFILRLCKDKFISNLNSTLGVDFQTKTIELDGRVIALQLWDTAGQERFRSVAKSYFRRADGVLLVYDCTYERSFLSVREWVEIIQESSSKSLPIMFIANKTDLRDEFQNDGRNCIRCVQKEEGERLAREYDGLFIECSAKRGDNIMEAVVELTRLMRANEDLEVQNVGLQLKEIKEKDKSKLVECCTL